MSEKKKNLCRTCAAFHHFRLNLFKRDKTHPRIYFISCSMSSVSGIPIIECDYYKKKKLKHRLGMAL